MTQADNLLEGKLDEFILTRNLGSGTQGCVMLGQTNSKKYAIKIYYKIQAMNQVKREAEFLKKFNHKNIVKLFEIRQKAMLMDRKGNKKECPVLILEYIQGHQILQIASMKRVPQPLARAIFKIILQTLQIMHSLGIAHCDFKVDNILMTSNFDFKIIDFGCSVNFNSQKKEGIKSFESFYWPPQVYQNAFKQNQMDIFALGVIIFWIVVGKAPFNTTKHNDKNYLTFKKQQTNQIFWDHFKKQGEFSQQFIQLINRMLHCQRQKRLTIQQLFDHPWVKAQTYNRQQICQYFSSKKNQKHIQITFLQNNNGQYRSPDHKFDPIFTELIQPYLKTIEQSPTLNQNDYVINISPQLFLLYCNELFTNKNYNFILDQCQQQRIKILQNAQEKQIIIKWTYRDFQIVCPSKIILKLYNVGQNKTKIEFNRNPDQQPGLISYQLINLIKRMFESLRQQLH